MADTPILYRVEDQIAWISINQPEKMNRLNFASMRELARLVDVADKDPGVRVIVISGEGGKAFCAGGDLGDFAADNVLAGKENLQGYADLCLVFNRITTPLHRHDQRLCPGRRLRLGHVAPLQFRHL